jgi:hypothetical protein
LYFSLFYRSLEKKRSIFRNIGLKEQTWEKLKFLLERLIVGDLRSSALAIERPSQGMSTSMLACARRRIEGSAIERIRALVNSKVDCPTLEIGLGFCFTISRVSRCF